MEPEGISAAAIRHEGVVYEGTRHVNISIELKDKFEQFVDGERGFVTSKNRFVGRAEAARLAWERKQTNQRLDALYSEEVRFYVEKEKGCGG